MSIYQESISESFLDAGEVENLVRTSEKIRVIRSGLKPRALNDFVSAIRKGCIAQRRPAKDVRIILISNETEESKRRIADLMGMGNRNNNLDIDLEFEKARAVEEIREAFAQWRRETAQLKAEFKTKKLSHTIDLRLSNKPHRYHAYAGDQYAYIGVAWHLGPSLTEATKSILAGRKTSLYNTFIADFDAHWDTLSPKPSVARPQADPARTLHAANPDSAPNPAMDEAARRLRTELKTYYIIGKLLAEGVKSRNNVEKMLSIKYLNDKLDIDMKISSSSMSRIVNVKLAEFFGKFWNEKIKLFQSGDNNQGRPARFTTEGEKAWQWTADFLRRELGCGWFGFVRQLMPDDDGEERDTKNAIIKWSRNFNFHDDKNK